MDIFSLYHVRQAVLKAGVQTGKTTAIHILLAREADYSNGNDSALVVMADEKSVKKLSGNRLIHLFTDSPGLRQLISSNPDDTTIYSIKLNNNFRIDIGWATSEVSVSSEAYRILVLDEIAKYPKNGNIADMKGRTNTYQETCKRWILSSPDMEGSPIDTEFNASDVIFDYYPICPYCGESQIMTFDRFHWPGKDEGNAKPGQIRLKKLARYHCKDCGMPWDDNDRDLAVLAAMKEGEYKGWKPRGEQVERFMSASCHYPSWISPLMSLSEVVAQWLEVQGVPEMVKKWHNLIAGDSYKEEIIERVSENILKLRDDRPEGLIPSVPIAAVTAVFDMQKRGFWYSIRAWGYGLEQESWLLKYGYVETWDALQSIFWESEFSDVAGNKHYITYRMGDSGGGESENSSDLSRTAEAYLFACRNPGIVLWKGKRTMSNKFQNPKRLDRIPGTTKPLPGSPLLYVANTTHYKDRLAAKLQIEPVDPGAWHLHNDVSDSFARQMTAEYKNDKGFYECPKGRDNHLWDCAAMELALVDIMSVNTMRPPSNKPQGQQPKATNTRELPNWRYNLRR